ncbi:hypothetical protein TRFO_39287 [Tritrichomonas foetus]|uniref:Uncharacterized protein n=1 Tax=Tritrichomonas foetus TaxID=1144522 RepID=A0A1J4J5M1_9EUKA|nr:hypothetical protein TRFO_39287 [Tritrichomonas foetus]|eukprot:OHS94538.1 hypothetical protein TRFO_39287 [Tritrichomonas foetus]
MIDLAAFKLTGDSQLPPNQISAELSNLRKIVNKQFYSNLNVQQQEFFHNFLWEVLHQLWRKHQTPTVRIAASLTVGTSLVKLAPFYAHDFMGTLRDAIMNCTSESFLYVTSFCYLAKFHSSEKLSEILNETPLLHLFGSSDSEHLPALVEEFSRFFPRDFLGTAAEYFLTLASKNLADRHFPKAASIIFSSDIQSYSSMITENIHLLLLDSIFPEKFPIFNEKTATKLKERAIEVIKDDNPSIANYEAACRVLNKLILSNQTNPSELTSILDETLIRNTPSLSSLFLLPVPPDIIRSMYKTEDANLALHEINQSSSIFSMDSFSPQKQTKYHQGLKIECDKQYIVPLFTYFSINIEYFDSEIVSLISQNLTPTSDFYSNALSALGNVSSKIDRTSLNDLVTKALLINTNNWIHTRWTLQMLGKVKFTSLEPQVSDMAFDLIDNAVVSKSENLQKSAKEVSIKIFNHCKIEVFKLFIDRFCRSFDMFDQQTFEYRISYLSYIFTHTPTTWTISFLHIATLLTEAVSLVPFSATIKMEIFTIIGILAQNLREPLVLLFAKQAIGIIEPSYKEFVGEPIGMGRPPIFIVVQEKNKIQTNTDTPSILTKIDSDINSNPGLSHKLILRSAEAAFGMLAKVQWSQFNFGSDDACYLFFLATKLLNLFPDLSNTLVTSMIDTNILGLVSIETFVANSLKLSVADNMSLLTICRLISLIAEHYPSFNLENFQTDEISQTLNETFPKMRDIDFLFILAVQKFMSMLGITVKDEHCLKVVKKSQRHLLTDNSDINTSDEDIIDPSLLYGTTNEEEGNYPGELKTSEFDMSEISPLVENFGLLDSVSSLTPFYFLHLEVPQELLKVPLIYGFSAYSQVKISPEEGLKLLDNVLLHGTNRCLYFILRYFARQQIDIDLSDKIMHPLFSNRSVMNAAIPLLKIKSLPNDYISRVLGSDLINFTLNASTMFQRRTSIGIMRLDPVYFMTKILEVPKLKFKHLSNLVVYAANVPFPPNDFFSFSSKIIQRNAESRRKQNLARRLFTVFVSANQNNREIVINANNLLTCEVIPLSSPENLKKLSAAQIVEYYFEIATISKMIHCGKVIETLCQILPKNTIYGASLEIIVKNPTLESITHMLQSPIASLATLPYRFIGEKLRLDPGYQHLTPQIIDVLLQQKVISTASTETSILTFILHFLSFKNIQRSQFKNSFAFMHNNIKVSTQCAALTPVMQLYFKYLKIILPTIPELQPIAKAISEFADKLFDYPVVPNGAVDILQVSSVKTQDPTHVAMILTPYLKMNDAYNMFSVCENAAVHTIINWTESEVELDDAINVVQIARSFFATFNGIVAAEKMKPGMKHDLMKGLFHEIHEYSLKLLEDEKMKVFAPIFALLDENHEMPHILVNYLENVKITLQSRGE